MESNLVRNTMVVIFHSSAISVWAGHAYFLRCVVPNVESAYEWAFSDACFCSHAESSQAQARSVDHSANTSTTSPLATSKSASFDVVFNVTGLVHGLVASASGRVGSGAHSNDPDSGSFVVRFHYDWAPLVCMAFCDCVSKRV